MTMLRTFLVLVLFCVVSTFGYSPELQGLSTSAQRSSTSTRRGFLASTSSKASLLVSVSPFLVPQVSFAENDLVEYQDTDCKFSILVPTTWETTTQSLPDRRKIVFYFKPGSERKTFLFVAYTPVRSDFTSLGSFGSVDEVAQATILPKSTLAGVTDVTSKMLSAESKKQAYFFDYVTKVPNQPETHFRTIFSLATAAAGGAGNVLVSITAQTPESEYEAMKPLFDKIIDSYK